MDFHSCSSIYKAGMTYYNDYIRGYAEDVQVSVVASCRAAGSPFRIHVLHAWIILFALLH